MSRSASTHVVSAVTSQRGPCYQMRIRVSHNPNDKPIQRQANNPLHGLTLEVIVVRLAEHYGWADLGEIIPLNCFRLNPSVRSSLKYLRMTPKARARVEELYLATFRAG
jgi:uncharacterized protein (DUF2132 family)